MKGEIPVKKNHDYEINISGIGVNGEGVGKINGFTMFVEGALPGERVKIKAVKITKNYGYGKLLHIIQKSKDRIKPVCDYFSRCGGCQLQHISYGAQLSLKKQIVMDNLNRIGKIEEAVIHDTIGMEDPWLYRNKAQFPVGLVRESLAIGFYAPRSHNLINIDKCHIQHGINDKVMDTVRKYMNTYNVKAYDEATHMGVIRHVVAKVGFKSNQLMIIVVTNGHNLPRRDELVDMIRKNMPGVTSIIQNINSIKTNVVLGDKNITLWGDDYIYDAIGNLKFKISPLSFFQVNPVQTEVLYKKALDYAELTGNDTVIDLYSGIGTISLFMASKAKKVLGIEVVPQAVSDAKENARINNIENVEFMEGKVEEVVPKLERLGINPDVVVVDPPRKGCDAILLNSIKELSPKRVIYVSCNPSTLARDLKTLEEYGYKTREVQPVDMFPHTNHVECVALMSRTDK